MFTGLVKEVGQIVGTVSSRLCVEAPKTATISQIGDSIAINGCCLTIAQINGSRGSRMDFDLLQETIHHTNFSDLQPGSPVNCEPSLAANERLGGHFVQGHVDTTAKILSAGPSGTDFRLEIEIPSGCAHYLIYKGSIAVNGVSLTIAELKEGSFVTWIIPHTLEQTNLGSLQSGNRVNLEFDLLAKYVERMSVCYRVKPG